MHLEIQFLMFFYKQKGRKNTELQEALGGIPYHMLVVMSDPKYRPNLKVSANMRGRLDEIFKSL